MAEYGIEMGYDFFRKAEELVLSGLSLGAGMSRLRKICEESSYNDILISEWDEIFSGSYKYDVELFKHELITEMLSEQPKSDINVLMLVIFGYDQSGGEPYKLDLYGYDGYLPGYDENQCGNMYYNHKGPFIFKNLDLIVRRYNCYVNRYIEDYVVYKYYMDFEVFFLTLGYIGLLIVNVMREINPTFLCGAGMNIKYITYGHDDLILLGAMTKDGFIIRSPNTPMEEFKI